jgi:hypothetical protein
MLERRKRQEMGEAGWQLRSQIFVFCLVAWKPAISGRRNKGTPNLGTNLSSPLALARPRGTHFTSCRLERWFSNQIGEPHQKFT